MNHTAQLSYSALRAVRLQAGREIYRLFFRLFCIFAVLLYICSMKKRAVVFYSFWYSAQKCLTDNAM